MTAINEYLYKEIKYDIRTGYCYMEELIDQIE